MLYDNRSKRRENQLRRDKEKMETSSEETKLRIIQKIRQASDIKIQRVKDTTSVDWWMLMCSKQVISSKIAS